MATRQSVKALNKSASNIAAEATAEKARKAASRKALRDAKKLEAATLAAESKADDIAIAAWNNGTPSHESEMVVDHKQQDAANALATAKADAESTGVPLEQMLADMGIDATGYPVLEIPTLGTPRAPRARSDARSYDGPMLALRQAVKAYVTPQNGNPCNGDALATACGSYDRSIVVKALVAALGLEGNPYLHLNPGQQSMNLRNKARARLTAGTLTMGDISTALNVAYILSPEFAVSKAAAEAKQAALATYQINAK